MRFVGFARTNHCLWLRIPKRRSNTAMATQELNQARSVARARSAKPRSKYSSVILAFAAVYLIWGSTYLAIHYAIQTLPPFFMAGTRFLIAGALLFTWSSFRSDSGWPTARQWVQAFVLGALLLLCGNGGVTWAEKYIASGLAALLIATEPLFIVGLNGILTKKRPNAKVLLGVLIGLLGVGLLVSGGLKGGTASPAMKWVGAGAVITSALAWAVGSVYLNHRPMQASTSMASGMQMLAGGSLLSLTAIFSGELRGFRIARTSWVSISALGYLIVFGSIIAFTCYSWLLKNVAPSRASTYAYVNPVVAVFLGWLIASEPLSVTTLVAAGVIVGSVVLITTYGRDHSQLAEKESETTDGDCPVHPCA